MEKKLEQKKFEKLIWKKMKEKNLKKKNLKKELDFFFNLQNKFEEKMRMLPVLSIPWIPLTKILHRSNWPKCEKNPFFEFFVGRSVKKWGLDLAVPLESEANGT